MQGIWSCIVIFIGQNILFLCVNWRAWSIVRFPLTATHCITWTSRWQLGVSVDLRWDLPHWQYQRNSAAAKRGPEKEKHFHQANETCQPQQGSRAWSPRMQGEQKSSQQEEGGGGMGRKKEFVITPNSSRRRRSLTGGCHETRRNSSMVQQLANCWLFSRHYF